MAQPENTDCSSDARRCSAAEGPQLPGTPDRSADDLDPNLRAMFWRYEKTVVLINHRISQDPKAYTYKQACDDCDWLEKMRQQIVDEIVDQEKQAQVTEGR